MTPIPTELRELLERIVAGDVGRMIYAKLATGQATETDDGKAWLELRALLATPPADAALEAECERLRSQVSALQSDANSWQSGYDKGREDGAKAAEGWKAQHARDSAELRRLCAERDALHAEAEALLPVTHWMPLPAAPALAASTGQEVK